jgi:hypothetical protein
MNCNGDVEPKGFIIERPRNEAGDAGCTRIFLFSWSLVFSAPRFLPAHDLVRKPVPIRDQVEDKLFGIMRYPRTFNRSLS